MKNAFTKTQQKAIKTTKIANKNNQRYGTKGGANTKDKLFLLSLEDMTKKKYGFTNYDFKNGNGSIVGQSNFFIDSAKTRVPTQFVKTGKDTATGSSCYQDNWWLRSPGGSETTVSYVGIDGSVTDMGWLADIRDDGVCPAMHIDLSKAKYKSAGIVVCGDVF